MVALEPSARGKSATARPQVELSQEWAEQVDRLAAALRLKTRKEIVENALALFAWAVQERLEGKSLVSLNKETDSYLEFIFPFLTFLNKSAKKLGPTLYEHIKPIQETD